MRSRTTIPTWSGTGGCRRAGSRRRCRPAAERPGVRRGCSEHAGQQDQRRPATTRGTRVTRARTALTRHPTERERITIHASRPATAAPRAHLRPRRHPVADRRRQPRDLRQCRADRHPHAAPSGPRPPARRRTPRPAARSSPSTPCRPRPRSRALRGLGLTVQPMHRLPLALVAGPGRRHARRGHRRASRTTSTPTSSSSSSTPPSTDAMASSAPRGAARRASPARASPSASSTPAATRTHPDLADHVKHNVSLVSAGVRQPAGTPPPRSSCPSTRAPYSNTDLGCGHGTHVAGIVAADSSSVTDGSGSASPRTPTSPASRSARCCSPPRSSPPTTTCSTSPTCSASTSSTTPGATRYRQFDPRDPVAVATKAVADQGVTVVFAAGNSGAGDAEMSLNPFTQSPWVISVAAGTLDRHRGDFSSNGLTNDNSRADRDRRRRPHRLHRRPHRPRPPRHHRSRRGHLLDLRHAPAPSIGPCPPGRERHGLRHVDGRRRTSPARPPSSSRPTRR